MLIEEVQACDLDRESLERLALLRICACLYYDLADCIDAEPDQELVDIVNHRYECVICNLKGVK